MSRNETFFAAQETHAAFSIHSEPEACAAVLYACRKADEIEGPGGTAALMGTLKQRNIFIGTDPQQLLETSARYFELAGSPSALIDAAISGIREQTRLPLFYHCLDMILADGVVTPQEHKVFQYLRRKFNVAEEVAFTALDVLVVKNQL